ncbi:pickpocket protein 28-like [Anoplophora glabripennis]|uniref:pickpocket protein 28-like n=1 Tax=Anoplophora glabripennis TaxID=217634 RepID=UPI000C759D11|nr:pickpocket protein 28-like [Anoplophora glabripennis]
MELRNRKISPEIEPNKRKYSCFQNFGNYCREYCREGTLHGVKYLGEKRTFIEKLWWAISMAVALYLCVTLILKTYEKWERSPVIVTFATKETPNLMIPFPSVTICPDTKSLPGKYNYTKYYRMLRENKTLEPDMEKKFGYLSLLCDRKNEINYADLKDQLAGNQLFDFIDEVSPKFSDMISECKFMGVEENCTELFFPIITDEGLCYTFNLLDRSQLLRDDVVIYKDYHKAPRLSNWTIQYGYGENDSLITYPRRALFSGAIFALEAKLKIYEQDLDFACGSSVQGYKVQLSHPARMPRPKQQHFRIPLNHVFLSAVTPDMTTTADAIKSYSPLKRNCYFPNEKSLKYFKVYSQQSCQIECKTNYTLNECGCVNFYMPRNNETKFCTGSKIACIYDAEKALLFSWMAKKLEAIHEGKVAQDMCDCPPVCTSMYYNVENSQTTWDWKRHYDPENGTKHMSHFQVFFKSSQFITMERNELFGITDFLANFGGLLGLFIGFSMLSLIEIIYYLTLRIICNIKLFGINNWSGRKE